MPSNKRISIVYSSKRNQKRLALIDSVGAIEFYLRKDKDYSLGSVCKGKILKKVPSGNAYFVDIGGQSSGFLSSPAKIYTEGESVLVSVAKEAYGIKDIRLKDKISLSGVCMVYSRKIADESKYENGEVLFSKRLQESSEKERIKSVLTPLLEEGESIVIRHFAVAIPPEKMAEELNLLREKMTSVINAYNEAKKPCLLAEASDFLPEVIASNIAKLTEVVCDDIADEKAIIKFCLDYGYSDLFKITRYNGKVDIFEYYGLLDTLEEISEPLFLLPCGIRLFIERTEAFWAIDVDSSSFKGSIDEINHIAAKEILRQIRLRNLSGQIVIDFVSSKNRHLSKATLELLRQGLAEDSMPAFVAGISPLGHVEIIRERRSQSIPEYLSSFNL